jgi:hypothetical protein
MNTMLHVTVIDGRCELTADGGTAKQCHCGVMARMTETIPTNPVTEVSAANICPKCYERVYGTTKTVMADVWALINSASLADINAAAEKGRQAARILDEAAIADWSPEEDAEAAAALERLRRQLPEWMTRAW